MKSILQEGNSIERAIDKAWNQAGKPKEFTIKILEEGERNFLGLSRRPAIVTIFYKPEKATAPQQGSEKSSRNDRHDRRDRRDREVQQQEARTQEHVKKAATRRYAGTDEQRAAFTAKGQEGWTEEWRLFVENAMRDLVKQMGYDIDLDVVIQGDKVLTISFKQMFLEDEEEQKMLFSTFSYIAMQFLKRHYKNRFTGHRIMVTGPKSDGSSMVADCDAALARPEPRPRTPRPEGQERSRNNGPRDHSQRSGHNNNRPPRRDNSPRPAHPGTEAPLLINDRDDDILADQIRFAQEQLKRESSGKSSPSTGNSKKDKYPPFFVLDEDKK